MLDEHLTGSANADHPGEVHFPDGNSNQETVVAAALDYWAAQGLVDYDDAEHLKQTEDELAALYRSVNGHIQPTPTSGDLTLDRGVTLTLMWQEAAQRDYERSLPVWRCDCGAAYKQDVAGLSGGVFFTIDSNGLFDEAAGSLHGKAGIGKTPRNTEHPYLNGSCPDCSRPFKTTIARQSDPQTSLLL